MAVNVNNLSNDELRRSLQEHGFKDVGPIVTSTRELYARKLKRCLREEEGGRHLPRKKRKIDDLAADDSPLNAPIPNKRGNYKNRERNLPQKRSQTFNRTNKRPSPVPSAPPRPTPKLAADSSSTSANVDDSTMPVFGFRPSLSTPELRINRPNAGLGPSSSDVGISPSHVLDLDDSPDSDDLSMEISSPSPPFQHHLNRKPLRKRGRNSTRWLGESLSSTARLIGEGMKSFVSSFLTPPAPPTSATASASPLPSAPPLPSHKPILRNQDSVVIGGEIEIQGSTHKEEVDLSPEPSAPPLPMLPQQPVNVTHYDWELLPEDVQFCVREDGSKWHLGKGGFGEVFKGIKDGVDEVAVKVIKLQHQQQSSINQFKQEIDLISKLRHRNILQFYGACIRTHFIYMVTELMDSDLFTALRKGRQYTWAGEYGKEVCIGIATGLHYLHSKRPPIVHRDIKSPNILLIGGLAKIADVGIARAKMESDMTAQRGFTIAWAAPEVIYRRRATEKIDIWSYGVVLWEVVTGRPPGVGKLVMPTLSAPVQVRTIFNDCTKEDPSLRPATDQILVSLKAIH